MGHGVGDAGEVKGDSASRVSFYKAVVQVVLIHNIYIWVVMDSMMKVLEEFHHHIALRIAIKMLQHVGEDGW